MGGFDFAPPGGETLSFDPPAPAAAGPVTEPDPGGVPFDVAGSGVGDSPFTETVDQPLFGEPPVASAPGGISTEPDFDLPGGLGGPGAPAAAGAPPAAEMGDIFGAPPAADPFGGDAPGGGSPFDTPFAPAPSPAPLVPSPAVEVGGAGGDEYLRQQISDAITPVLGELVTELRRSLDFYRNRANGQGAQRLVITGGTACLPGLAPFLTANLEVPVVLGNAMEYVGVSAPADAEYLSQLAPLFPVSVGLAVRDMLFSPPVARPARAKKK
jgi:type IV pilus assembly protein PilM